MDINQKQISMTGLEYGNHTCSNVPLDATKSQSEEEGEPCNSTVVAIDETSELQDILKLHKQINEDIELKLRTADNNFRACYKKIVMKSRGNAPVAALATAFVNFGKVGSRSTLPILHNSRSHIRVQPTTVARRKCKIKSTRPQPKGPRPKMSSKKQKQGRDRNSLKPRKTARTKRPHKLGDNVKSSMANAGHSR